MSVIEFFCNRTGYSPEDILNIQMNCNQMAPDKEGIHGPVEYIVTVKNGATIFLRMNND